MRNTLHVFTAIIQVGALAYAIYLIGYAVYLHNTNIWAFIYYNGHIQAQFYIVVVVGLNLVHLILSRMPYFVIGTRTPKEKEIVTEPVTRDNAYYADVQTHFKAMYGPRP